MRKPLLLALAAIVFALAATPLSLMAATREHDWSSGVIIEAGPTGPLQPLSMIWPVGMLVIVLLYFLVAWLLVGRDRVGGVVVARWHPPDDVSPAIAAYVEKQGLRRGQETSNALAGTALDLAVKGLLTLTPEKRSVRLERTAKPAPRALSPEQKQLLRSVEKNDGRLIVGAANSSATARLQRSFLAALSAACRNRYFVRNLPYSVVGFLVSLGIPVLLWKAGTDITNLLNLAYLGVCLLAVVTMFIGPLSTLFANTSSASKRWILVIGSLCLSIGLIFMFALFLMAVKDELSSDRQLAGVAILSVTVALNIVFYVLLAAPTAAGRSILREIAGLKAFIALAEGDRLQFSQRLETENIEAQTLLPYAVALGMETAWRTLFGTGFVDAAVYGETDAITGALSNPADIVDAFSSDLAEQERRNTRRIDER